MNYYVLVHNKINNMKNLKKMSTQELKTILGGAAPEWCVGPGGCWDHKTKSCYPAGQCP